MTLALHYALRSDVGLLREGNEDSAYAGPRLLAIADGMGGHAAGEVASAVAISAIAPLDRRHLTDSEEMLAALGAAVASARNTLHDMSASDPTVEGMGTTLTAMLWAGARVAVCHIGDSRAYLLRDGDLYQITRDHTLIQSLVDEGRLSPAAAANHPQRSLIMRALQGSTDADPDLAMHDALPNDRYLLCSDGLTDVVDDEAVHEVLTSIDDPGQAVNQLITLAIRNGGPDNITCIVADAIDPATSAVQPTRDVVLAGAAANGDAKTLLGAATTGPRPTMPGSQPSANMNGSKVDAAALPDVGGGYDDLGEPRRRWPLVTGILAVLVLVIAGGLYFGYKATQNQYYVGSDANHVVIYRGINQKIAWVNLSSVYQRTNVPTSHVPGDLTLPTTPTTLAKAQATVATIQHLYTCKQDEAQLQAWNAKYANRPKPKPSKNSKTPTVHIPPKPTVPASCPAQGAG
ncbi:MAG TPA: protein phosphatase 2C domain-containing protein [Streptosporangiaceae bacterium]|nr:protein phosphatase 2C domain-containing protein [Streptosporangiaceae bacterium]